MQSCSFYFALHFFPALHHALQLLNLVLEGVGSVVVVAFQIAFCVEIHVNDVFLVFKNHF
jgi:hypothetical protein